MRRRLVGLMAVVLLLLVAVPGPGSAADNDPVRLMLNLSDMVPVNPAYSNNHNYSQLNPTWR